MSDSRILFEQSRGGLFFNEEARIAAFSNGWSARLFCRRYSDWLIQCCFCVGGQVVTLNYKAEVQRVKAQRRRARQCGRRADLVWWQWLRILRRWRGRCAYCGGPFETMDHIVPLVCGGGTTRVNVVPACLVCNSAKGAAVWL